MDGFVWIVKIIINNYTENGISEHFAGEIIKMKFYVKYVMPYDLYNDETLFFQKKAL